MGIVPRFDKFTCIDVLQTQRRRLFMELMASANLSTQQTKH